MHQYLTEIQTCFSLGSGWSNRLALALAGLEFHVSNFLGFPAKSTASTYRMRLGGARNIQLRRRSGDFFVFHEIFTEPVAASSYRADTDAKPHGPVDGLYHTHSGLA